MIPLVHRIERFRIVIASITAPAVATAGSGTIARTQEALPERRVAH